MGRSLTCDRCGKPTNRIAMKLYLTPVNGSSDLRRLMSNYTGHVDIGECCASLVTQGFKWQKRQKRKQRV